jgi:hypothetical protein
MNEELDTTEGDVRTAFARLVLDEPPLGVDATAAIEAGRRTARRRVLYRTAAVAAAAAVATAVVATVAPRNGNAPASATPTVAVSSPNVRLTASHGRVPVGDGGAPRSALDQQLIDIIRANSPSNFEFAFGGGGTDQSSVDGTADDGAGAGRVYVWTAGPGMLTREPCGDSDFVQGASCTETHVGRDGILSVRGLVDYQGIQTYDISLTHADGSGVGAEVGNFTVPALPDNLTVLTPADKARLGRPTVTRSAPIYDAAQIAALVQAVDSAVNP